VADGIFTAARVKILPLRGVKFSRKSSASRFKKLKFRLKSRAEAG